MIYLVEICYLIYCIATAFIQSQIFKAGKSINHTLWGGIYAAFAVGMVFILPHDYLTIGYFILLMICAIMIREIFFAPALNLFRKREFFYFNPDGKSFIDRLIKTRKRYIAIYIISVFIFIYFQTWLP